MGSSQSLSSQIRDRVAAAIDASGQGYTPIGERAGIPKSTMERRLSGHGKAFDVDELEQLALVLGLDPDAFMDSRRWPEAS
jgi:hypothetical protein